MKVATPLPHTMPTKAALVILLSNKLKVQNFLVVRSNVNYLHCSPNTVQVIKSRMRWAWCAERIGRGGVGGEN
jgi:hypothetical protein